MTALRARCPDCALHAQGSETFRARCPDYSLHARGPATFSGSLPEGFMLAVDLSFLLWEEDGGKILTHTAFDHVPRFLVKRSDYSLHVQGPRLAETATAFWYDGFMIAADESYMLWADNSKILTYTSRNYVPTLRARQSNFTLRAQVPDTLHAKRPDFSLHAQSPGVLQAKCPDFNLHASHND